MSSSFTQLCEREHSVHDLFRLIHPRMPFTFHNIRLFINASYILELRSPSGRRPLSRLRQQMSTCSVLEDISVEEIQESAVTSVSRAGTRSEVILTLKGKST